MLVTLSAAGKVKKAGASTKKMKETVLLKLSAEVGFDGCF